MKTPTRFKPDQTVAILRERLPSQMLLTVGDATTGVVLAQKGKVVLVQLPTKTMYFLERELEPAQSDLTANQP